MVKTWIVLCSGFLQNEGTLNGIEQLWSKVRTRHSSPDVSVEYRPWNTDWRKMAEFMFRLRDHDDPPRIMLVGFSWGGYGMVCLARELAKRGLLVETLILSDAVYRSQWMVWRWLSMTGFPRIHVPPNVRDVHWFRQRNDWPRGHEVVPETHFRTSISTPVILDVTHSYADDAAPFHDLTLEEAEKLCDSRR